MPRKQEKSGGAAMIQEDETGFDVSTKQQISDFNQVKALATTPE